MPERNVREVIAEMEGVSEELFGGSDLHKVENRSAQQRARLITNKLAKLFKEFRAVSIKVGK